MMTIRSTRSLALLLCALLAACTAAGPADDERSSAVAAATNRATTGDDAAARAPRAAEDRQGTILFIGTSLTAGYGLGESFAYPALLQQRIDSAGLPYRVVNAGISGETSAGGLRRIDWMLQQPVDVLVVELGANDGLRGLPVEQLRRNLEEIIRRTRDAHPDADVVLIGMEAPPNLGATYTRAFRAVYSDLADRYDAALVPFLLDGVAGEPAFNLGDGIHPNVAGQQRLARTVWPVLAEVLERRR